MNILNTHTTSTSSTVLEHMYLYSTTGQVSGLASQRKVVFCLQTCWFHHQVAPSLQSHNLKTPPSFVPLPEGPGTPISPSTPTITSTSKPSLSPHPATTSTNQGTWPRLTPLLTLTHPPEQKWGGLLQTASALPAAPTRVAVTGRSTSGWTSTCSPWVGQRAGRVRRSNECGWTAGWHKPCSHVTTQDQDKRRKDTVMQMKCGFYWCVLLFFMKLSLFLFWWSDFWEGLSKKSLKILHLSESSHHLSENLQFYLHILATCHPF